MGIAATLSGQRVLVTGASGFIGSHLCLRLRQEGAEVHAVYRSRLPAVPDDQRWWQADLAEQASVRELVNKIRPDVIFHLASHVKGEPGIEQVIPTFQSNLQSTVNLLTAAVHFDCRRIILTGSLTEPEAENGETFPTAPYAAAKWASTGYARMFHALYKLPVRIARVFMVYGPGQMDLTKLIPYVALSLLEGKTPKLTSGSRLVDWIFVSDVVDGLLALAQAPDVDGITLDLGSGALLPIRDIIQRLTGLIGGDAEFGALLDRPLEPTRVANIGETLARTGWAPQVSLQQGLMQTVDWYRANMASLTC